MIKRWGLFLFIFSAFLTSSLSFLFAGQERIKSIHADGTLEFQSGMKVKLLGVELSHEAFRILPTLLADNDLDIEEDRDVPAAGDIKSVYVFVKSKEIDFPFSQSSGRESKGMINRFLISTGAAKVALNPPFKYLAEFQQLQEQAKIEGEGIWSYDIPEPKTSS